jgi:hypothetical protein
MEGRRPLLLKVWSTTQRMVLIMGHDRRNILATCPKKVLHYAGTCGHLRMDFIECGHSKCVLEFVIFTPFSTACEGVNCAQPSTELMFSPNLVRVGIEHL